MTQYINDGVNNLLKKYERPFVAGLVLLYTTPTAFRLYKQSGENLDSRMGSFVLGFIANEYLLKIPFGQSFSLIPSDMHEVKNHLIGMGVLYLTNLVSYLYEERRKNVV